MLIMALLGLGFGIIVSSLTTKYRDLQQLVGFGVQLLMYATPVIYPLSTIHGIWRWVILANPMTPVVEVFRLAFLGVSAIDPLSLLYSAGFAVVVFLVGLLIFNHVENTLWIRFEMSDTVISIENVSKSYRLGTDRHRHVLG